MALYIPETGDIVWLDFSPQAGHEQAGHRPAVVLTPAAYNRRGLMLCCPMTTQIKGYPGEVIIGADKPSVALADHLRSVDWKARRAKYKGRVTVDELAQIRAVIHMLLGK